MDEHRLRRLLMGGAALELAAAAGIVSGAAPDVLLVDAAAKSSATFRRLWVAFLLVLAASRAAAAASRARTTFRLTLFIHVVELAFFWREAYDRAREGTLDARGRVLVAAVLIIPASMLLVGPSEP